MRRGSTLRLVVAPLGGVAVLLTLALVLVGVSGPPSRPTLGAPAQNVGASSGGPSATATEMAAAKCTLLSQFLGTCHPSPGGHLGLEATLLLAASLPSLGRPSPTTSTTSSTSTSTTTSSSTTTSTSTTTTTTLPAGNCAGTTPSEAPPSGTWACTFDDEFNGRALDTTKWQPQLTATSGYTTGTAPNQVCYVNKSNTISESGGDLNLSVVHTVLPQVCKGLNGASSPASWQGGMVTSYQLFSQEYGYFQARAEMPASTVQGLQETLWLYPENQKLYGPWPDSGEIDYAEFYSDYAGSDFPVVHYPGSGDDPNSSTAAGCSLPDVSPAGQFNTYALSWTPTTITAYFNGVPCITDVYAPYVVSPDTAPEPFNQPFFLSFTAALGISNNSPGQSTPSSATTKLDWVRVWQYG